MMNHEDACTGKMVEKYLLGELSATDRDSFEAHYFSCQECAEEVKAGAVFVDNAREVLRADSPPKLVQSAAPAKISNWWAWLQPAYAAAAIVILAAGILFQNLVTIPRMKQELSANRPQVEHGFTLRPAARSSEVDTIEAAPHEPFGIFVDIPPDDSYSSYTCQVQTEAGASKFSVEVSAAAARDSVELYVPGSTLTPGRYVLVTYGHTTSGGSEAAGVEVARYPFTFRDSK
jgi:hypothetical protein